MNSIYLDESGFLKSIVNGIHENLDLKDASYINEVNNEFKNKTFNSFYCNEIFLYFYLKYKEWSFLSQKKSINKFQKRNNSIHKALWCDFVDNQQGTSVTDKTVSALKSMFMLIVSVTLMLCFYFAMFIVLPYKKSKSCKVGNIGNKVIVVRSPAGLNKVKQYAKDKKITIISEGIVYQNNSYCSLFSLVSFWTIVKLLFTMPNFVFFQFKKLHSDCKLILPDCSFSLFLNYYRYRILVSSIYYFLLRELLDGSDVNMLYTSNKEDRYALIEKELTSEFDIDLFCIPHGIEYGFRLPIEPVGNVFYTTSLFASNYLNKLYESNKFIFDTEVARAMFAKVRPLDFRKVVFFTEARGTLVNRDIITVLQTFDIDFYVKLHPKDQKMNYNDLDVSYIDDFDFAISNSVCICRKSTVLLEAIYNNSTSIAFVGDDTDRFYVRYIFPSLSNESIDVVDTSLKLYESIVSNLTKENDVNV